MNDFALPEETDGINNVRIVCKTQDIVVGQPRFLFRAHIF